MHVVRRVAATVAAAVMVAVVLTGCVPESRYYARLDADGVVSFLVCETINAVGVEVSTAPRTGGYDYTPVWDVTGKARIDTGDVIVVGEAPEGLDGSSAGPLDPANEHIRLVISDGDHAMGVTFTAGTMGEGWTDRDGNALGRETCP